jgi:predicted Zn-dependent peptidase
VKHSVHEYHVGDGASGLIINVPGSDVTSLQFRFNSGFQFANPKTYELPHVLEHLMASVTKRHPAPNEWNIEASRNGAYVNAMTSTDVNGYIYECADFELDRMLGLAEEQLAGPLIAAQPLESEIGNVREELVRNTTVHGSVCTLILAQAAFPNLWLDYDTRISQLPKITVEAMKRHYHTTHTSANARFFLAGDFEKAGEDKVVGRLGRLFAQLPVGKRLERSRDIGAGTPQPLVVQRDINQVYYRAMLYFGELTEPERRALVLLRMVLAGGLGSRVYGEARRRGLAYAVAAVGHAEPGNSGFGFGGYVTPDNAVPLFELMAREFRAVRNEGVTAEELEAAKDLIVGQIKRGTQTPGDLLGWYIERYDEAGEIRDFDKELALLREVRPDEVTAVARKASAGGRLGMGFVGAADELTAQKYAQVLTLLD